VGLINKLQTEGV